MGAGAIRLSLKTSLRLGFGVIVAVLLAVSAYAYWTAINDRSANAWVQHTNIVIEDATQSMITVADMQAQYDDYLMTGGDDSRKALNEDVDRVHLQLQDLSDLTADNPPQVERWKAIQSQIDTLNGTMLQPGMAARGAAGSAQSSSQDAHAAFSTIRKTYQEAIGVERQLLAQRTQTADEGDVRLEGVLLVGALASIALATACASVLLHQIEERARVQAQTDSVLNAAAEGIFGVDARGRVTMMNEAAQRITGFGFGDVCGRSLHTVVHHSHADGTPYPAAECPTKDALRNGQTCHVRSEVFWRKDGTSFPVEYTSVPIVDDGNVTGAVMTFHDISQQLAIDRMKDEFIGVVSHELRTPLTSIRASLGLLSAGMLGPLSNQARHMTDIALKNTERLVRLVSDVLDIERIESGKIAMQLEPQDARELISRSIDGLQPVALSAGVTLACEAESIVVCADADRIVQALTNLLGNAIKFSPNGSRVVVAATREGDMAHFSVRDQGRGIPQEKLESIFQRFEQVDVSDAKHKGGTGLGLPIARSIIRQHGGSIWAESQINAGSTFHFTLPIRG